MLRSDHRYKNVIMEVDSMFLSVPRYKLMEICICGLLCYYQIQFPFSPSSFLEGVCSMALQGQERPW